MIPKIGYALRELKSLLFLEHRMPAYSERADYYRQRAIVESVKRGIFIGPSKYVNLIDVTETTAITLPNKSKIELARNKDGIYFARIESGRYYPINTQPSEDLLKKSREYERASRSLWRRFLREPGELFCFGRIMYTLDKIQFNLDDIHLLLVQLEAVINNATIVYTNYLCNLAKDNVLESKLLREMK